MLAKYGIKPTQIPDYKGLAGDVGDNIMGVDGIGIRQQSSSLTLLIL